MAEDVRGSFLIYAGFCFSGNVYLLYAAYGVFIAMLPFEQVFVRLPFVQVDFNQPFSVIAKVSVAVFLAFGHYNLYAIAV